MIFNSLYFCIFHLRITIIYKLFKWHFENNFSCVRRRIFDGSFLMFPNLSQKVQLYPYQKNAVARILFSENTLLAHDVGSGKTYIMIAAGMELRRMNLSKKNLYVVPNNIVGQWRNIFKSMYPSAKFFALSRRISPPQRRNLFLVRFVTIILMRL